MTTSHGRVLQKGEKEETQSPSKSRNGASVSSHPRHTIPTCSLRRVNRGEERILNSSVLVMIKLSKEPVFQFLTRHKNQSLTLMSRVGEFQLNDLYSVVFRNSLMTQLSTRLSLVVQVLKKGTGQKFFTHQGSSKGRESSTILFATSVLVWSDPTSGP